MKMSRGIVAALLGTTMLAGAVAAQQTPAAPAPTTQQKTEAARDFMKLSADGAVAFRTLHLARIAIFEADPVAAKKLVADTRAALAKAKVDSTAFQKAEAELRRMPCARPKPTPWPEDCRTVLRASSRRPRF